MTERCIVLGMTLFCSRLATARLTVQKATLARYRITLRLSVLHDGGCKVSV
jgi:hypothetical protein